MSIDWFTVVAQLLNFLILVGLLKHFLYRPILDGIDAREQEIANRMGEADIIKVEAHATHRKYQQQVSQLRQQQNDTLASFRATVELERNDMLKEARQRINEEHKAAQIQQHRQAQQYCRKLQEQAGKVLLTIVRKAVKDLSDEALEERLVIHALTTLREDTASHDSRKKTDSSSTHALVFTREKLSATCQARLHASMTKHWPELTLSFTNNPKQSPGALVQLGSMQVDWTIDSYVSDLVAALSLKLLADIEQKK